MSISSKCVEGFGLLMLQKHIVKKKEILINKNRKGGGGTLLNDSRPPRCLIFDQIWHYPRSTIFTPERVNTCGNLLVVSYTY